jgi:hypothetical protein
MDIIRRPVTWLTFAAVLCTPLTQAEMTLQQAYQTTLDYNARLQGERARAEAEREGVSEAWSGVKPKLEATAALGSAKT